MCYERMLRYEPEDLIVATEDFRVSYERSIEIETSQYARAKNAQDMFTMYCSDVADIKRVATLPLRFNIYMKVQEMNKIIEEETN